MKVVWERIHFILSNYSFLSFYSVFERKSILHLIEMVALSGSIQFIGKWMEELCKNLARERKTVRGAN